MGMFQILANSPGPDSGSGEQMKNHQLLDNFMDVNLWAKEYIRTKFGMLDVGEDVAVVSLFFGVSFFGMF
jgi:hypothetical protein